MDKKQFLQFVENLVENTNIYKSDVDKNFYFYYYDNVMFNIDSVGDSVIINIKEKSRNIFSLSLNHNEYTPLLKTIFKKINENNLDYLEEFLKKYGDVDFFEVVNNFKDTLKSTDLSSLNEHLKKYEDLDRYKIFLDGKGNEQDYLFLGRIYSKNKPIYNLTSIVTIPLIVFKDDSHALYNLNIPGYELDQYPLLSNFIEYHSIENDFNKKFENMISSLSNEKKFLHDVLNFNINVQNDNISNIKHKI